MDRQLKKFGNVCVDPADVVALVAKPGFAPIMLLADGRTLEIDEESAKAFTEQYHSSTPMVYEFGP